MATVQQVNQALLQGPDNTFWLPPLYAGSSGGAVFGTFQGLRQWVGVGGIAGPQGGALPGNPVRVDGGAPWNPGTTSGPYVPLGQDYLGTDSSQAVLNIREGGVNVSQALGGGSGYGPANFVGGIPSSNPSYRSSGGGSMNGNSAIATLISQQQVSAAVASLFATQQALLVAQTTAPTKGPTAAAILNGISLGLGVSVGGAGAAAGSGSQAALLAALLGSSVMTSFTTALSTYLAALALPAGTFTTMATAHNVFLTAIQSALSTMATNSLIAGLSGGGNIIGLLLSQNANTAFTTANPQAAVPFTTGTMDTAYSTLETSFLAWLNAQSLNAILASGSLN